MDDLAAALASFDSASGQSQKAMYGAALAEAARGLLDARSGGSGHSSFYRYDDDDDVDVTPSDELLKCGCINLGVSMNGNRPFTYDGVQYDSIQNAFQAQKAPPSERASFSTVMPSDAARMGRSCKIDIDEWNANRASVMTELYRAQVAEHRDMANTLYKWRMKTIKEDAILDPFWQMTMPTIWKTIGREILMQYERGDEEESDDDKADKLAAHGRPKAKRMRC